MSHTPHELHDEFPDLADQITALKTGNAHFARLAEAYHEINRAVHRAETNVEPVSDTAETEMRRRRAALKDELYRMLTAGSQG
ncbi:MAG: YdcH family protein [Pseudomonadota bacterium]